MAEETMRYATVILLALFLVGCSNPEPMSQAEAEAIKACLEKSNNTEFDIQTNGRRLFTCGKKK